MIEIIPFKKEHAKYIAEHRINTQMLNVKENYLDLLDQLEKPNMSWTGLINNKIMAAGGLLEMWPHVFEGWVMATVDINKHPISTARIIKKIFNEVMVTNQVHRLQTTVKADYEIGHKFAQWLGLQQEGLMKKYLDNEDYNLYARIF